jgi:hypothetical protein
MLEWIGEAVSMLIHDKKIVHQIQSKDKAGN